MPRSQNCDRRARAVSVSHPRRLPLAFWPVQPIAFKLGPLTVHWFGVCIALAFLAGMWTAARRAPRIGVPGETIADLVVPWLLLGGILGARVMFIVTYWQDEFAGKPWWEIFMIQRGGLVFYGGLIGASLAVIVFALLKKVSVWKLADILAPSIALGSMFGRIGCLMNGCCYGRACELPWAIRFPGDHSTGGQPIHPTQIYDALLNLTLYVGLAWLFRQRRKFDGQIFAIYLMCYALTRSTVEFFRGDYSDAHLHSGFTPAHLLSVGIFAAGITLFFVLRSRSAKRG
jgi:phosphatidylglycerol:prolipoprotein diacylglycerol transferase